MNAHGRRRILDVQKQESTVHEVHGAMSEGRARSTTVASDTFARDGGASSTTSSEASRSIFWLRRCFAPLGAALHVLSSSAEGLANRGPAELDLRNDGSSAYKQTLRSKTLLFQ